MRTLRLSLAGAVILALLGGLGGVVVAQDEEPAPVTFVTGTVVEQWLHDDPSAPEEPDTGPAPDVRGYTISPDSVGGLFQQSVEWSDPRLPAEHWYTMRYQMIWDFDAEKGAVTTTTNHLLEDEVGGWLGSGRFVQSGGATDEYGFYMLEGQGAYEGLYALLHETSASERMIGVGPYGLAYEGYIFEAEPLSQPWTPVPVPATPGSMLTFSADWPTE